MPKSKPTILWSLCQLMYLMQICFLNTYRVYPKRIRTFKDSWDVGVQGKDRICSYIIWTEKSRRPSVYKGQLGWEKGRKKRRLAIAGGMGKAVPPSWLADHRSNTPTRWKDCSSFAKALVINEAGVDGEGTHQQDEVAAFKEHLPYLGGATTCGEIGLNLQVGYRTLFSIHHAPPIASLSFQSLPHFPPSSCQGGSHSAPSKGQKGTLVVHGQHPRTWQQTGKGKWWWYKELQSRQPRKSQGF